MSTPTKNNSPGLRDITEPRNRYLDWAITLNNYTDNDVENIRSAFISTNAYYACIGKEVGATGTPHLQAHISFRGKGKRRSEVSKLVPNSHLTAVQYLSSHIIYCKKDKNFEELGEQPSERSVRGKTGKSDAFQHAITAIKGGMVNSPDLRDAFPYEWSLHQRTFRQLIRDVRPLPKHRIENMYDWQRELLAKLDGVPDERQILFYVDFIGKAGKTAILKYLLATRPDDVQFFTGGKKDDIFHAIKESTKVFIFDMPRTGVQFLNYSALECVKNGLIFSPKYDSNNKVFDVPHVVVFMNEEPSLVDEKGMATLSEDRWSITYVEKPKATKKRKTPPPAIVNP